MFFIPERRLCSNRRPQLRLAMPSRPAHNNHRLLNEDNHHRKPQIRNFFLILFAGVCATVLLLLLLVVWFVRLRKSRRNLHIQTHPPDSSHKSLRRLKNFTYRELKKATNKFDESQKLGKGGYGVVYRGLLRNGEEVAVKKLVLSSVQGEREFLNELSICTRLESRYVVKLLGFASHGKKVRLLVYECMQNRSLQEALLEKHTSLHLNWDKRFGIILDVAKALAYLHLECHPPIIHGDVKPSNVLLDGDLRAYLADFGLARAKAIDQKLDHVPERSKSSVAEVEVGTPESSATTECKSYEFLLEKERKQVKVLDSTAVTSFGDQSLPSSYLNSPHSASQFSPDLGLDVEMLGSTAASPKMYQSGHSCLQKIPPIADHSCASKKNDDLTIHSADDSRLDQAVALPLARQAAQKAFNKDNWWWKQEHSGELNARDYVMEWMKSELSVDQNQSHVAAAQEHEQHQAMTVVDDRKDTTVKKKDRQEQRKRRAKDKEDERQEVTDEANKKEKAKLRAMRRKGREWWRDEYFAELSKKGVHSTGPKKPTVGRGNVGSMPASMDRLQLSNVTGSNSCRLQVDSVGEIAASDELSSTTTSMRGTVCYVAPEFGGVGVLSEASDIYSFGVLLLVIISGRRPLEIMTSTDKATGAVPALGLSPTLQKFERSNLITWARNLAYSGNVLDLVDDRLHGVYPREQAQLCISLALLCIRRLPSSRPMIGSVVNMLLGETTLPPLPIEFSPSPPSRLSFQQSPIVATSYLSSSEDMV